MLSQYADPSYALALLDDGSERRAYLLKERVSDPDQIVTAIRDVARGGSVIDPKVVEVLVSARSRARTSPLTHLTPREREVLAEIAQGRNNAAVGTALGLSERAVEKHISSAVLQARALRGARRPPPGQGGAALSRRGRRPPRRGVSPTPAGWRAPWAGAGPDVTMTG